MLRNMLRKFLFILFITSDKGVRLQVENYDKLGVFSSWRGRALLFCFCFLVIYLFISLVSIKSSKFWLFNLFLYSSLLIFLVSGYFLGRGIFYILFLILYNSLFLFSLFKFFSEILVSLVTFGLWGDMPWYSDFILTFLLPNILFMRKISGFLEFIPLGVEIITFISFFFFLIFPYLINRFVFRALIIEIERKSIINKFDVGFVIVTLLVFGVFGYFLFSKTTKSHSYVVRSWKDYIPEIKIQIKKNFPKIVKSRKDWEGWFDKYEEIIKDEVDITGDGVSEALVTIDCGANVCSYTIMTIENDKPVIMRIKREDGKIDNILFSIGGGVYYFYSLELVKEEKAIVSSYTEFNNEDSVRFDTKVYQYNPRKKIFEYNASLSERKRDEFCSGEGFVKIYDLYSNAPSGRVGNFNFEESDDKSYIISFIEYFSTLVSWREFITIKTDTNGIIQWIRDYEYFDEDTPILYKMDDKGNVIWSKTYDFENRINYHSSVITSDSGYIIGGQKEVSKVCEDNFSLTDIYLMKVDKNDNIQWIKTYTGNTIDTSDGSTTYIRYNLSSIKQLRDGGYVVVIDKSAFGCNSDFSSISSIVVKTDANGNIEWSRIYKGAIVASVYQVDDGGFVISGNTNTVGLGCPPSYVFLAKINANGNVQWSKFYKQKEEGFYFYTGGFAYMTDYGGFIIAGSKGVCNLFETSKTADRDVLFLAETDKYGNIKWSKVYDLGEFAEPYAVKQTKDGKFIIVGGMVGGKYYSDKVFLMKTDSKGNIGFCQVSKDINFVKETKETLHSEKIDLSVSSIEIDVKLQDINLSSVSRDITVNKLCSKPKFGCVR
jgi:predicted transcriptional regulator